MVGHLLVHGFTLSAFNTRVELPDRDAEHHEDAPFCWTLDNAQRRNVSGTMHSQATSAPVHRAANPVLPGLCVIKDHVLPPANEPRHIAQHSTVPPKSCALYSTARTQHLTVAQLYGFLTLSRFMFQRKICRYISIYYSTHVSTRFGNYNTSTRRAPPELARAHSRRGEGQP